MLVEEQRFLAAAIEHERVTPLQPRDDLALAGFLHEKIVDGFLGERLRRRLTNFDLFGVLPRIPEQARMYFIHGLGHPMGLAVHDVADRTQPLEAGTVWTLEPGVYVRRGDVEASETFKGLAEDDQAKVRAALDRYDGIGVRIEDDVLVTDGAPKVLSDGAPR